MSPNDDAPKEIFHETHEGSAGEPQRIERGEAPALTVQPGTLSEEELEKRQAAFSQRRRHGGPPLEGDETAARLEAVEAPPDVPPTECADPPSSLKEPGKA